MFLIKTDKGFTIIETIAVVLILGIVSVMTAVGVSYFKSMDVSAASDKLKTVFDRARLESMSHGDTVVSAVIEKEADGYYSYIIVKKGSDESIMNKTKLCGTGVTIYNNAAAISTEKRFTYKNGSCSFLEDYGKIKLSGKKTIELSIVEATGRLFEE